MSEELKAEVEANRSLAEKRKRELDAERKCSKELKDAMHIAIEGHARVLEQYANLEEKHVQLLERHKKIHDGIDDMKKSIFQNRKNLLILTVIKTNSSRVMDYINRLDNFDGPQVGDMAVEAQLYEEAYAISKMFNLNDQAVNVLLDNIHSIDRAVEFAFRVEEDTVLEIQRSSRGHLTRNQLLGSASKSHAAVTGSCISRPVGLRSSQLEAFMCAVVKFQKCVRISVELKGELFGSSGVACDMYSEVESCSVRIVTQDDIDVACGSEDSDFQPLLKPYQLVGVNFLLLLYRKGIAGAILADERNDLKRTLRSLLPASTKYGTSLGVVHSQSNENLPYDTTHLSPISVLRNQADKLSAIHHPHSSKPKLHHQKPPKAELQMQCNDNGSIRDCETKQQHIEIPANNFENKSCWWRMQ
ncbi:hypothetical protein KIW84_044796 [Lathyrus oleraceus]|uniref:Uncharacterized protein n=1 Tax=Pisum sativum TaxID=3888 RepID=A0A9D5AVU3_PEA|nr:hypothetical protein KIW84_044796 [Pisum sativum]